MQLPKVSSATGGKAFQPLLCLTRMGEERPESFHHRFLAWRLNIALCCYKMK